MRIHAAGILVLAGLLAGCGEREVVLTGERLEPRAVLGAPSDEPLDATAPAATEAPFDASAAAGTRAVPVSLPGPVSNGEWSHRGGNAQHRIGHVAAGASLTRVWTANAGQGESRRNRIAADPVVGGGAIYVMDAASTVTAVATNGGAVWQTSLTPPSDQGSDASGGGLAYAGGVVFATTGFGELVALDAGSGAVRWRQRFDAAVGGAPAVDGGTVYVVTRDAAAWAVRASDGKVLWTLPGAPANAGVAGVSAPAVDGANVIFPFAGGQLLAAEREEGVPVWQAFVAGKRLGRAFASVSDLTGDPVVANGVIYAGTSAGRLAAIDAATGGRLWSADEGAVSPVAAGGDAVWLVSDENQLIRLDAATGETVWRIDMPYFTQERDRRRKAIFAQYGPVLAGGRLITAGADGYLRSFDPASGAILSAVEIPGGAAAGPAIAGGTVYVLSRQGQLHAFR